MTIEEIEEELVLIRKQMVPLMKRQDYLSRQLEQLRSIRFISTHRITKSDVEFSSGEGKPYFSTVYDFARWMRSEQKIKRFAEWNGLIHFTSDLLSGSICDCHANIRDLPEGHTP